MFSKLWGIVARIRGWVCLIRMILNLILRLDNHLFVSIFVEKLEIMEINETAKLVHENAKAKGFFDEPKNIGEMLCLIHSEVSEALEADRNGTYAHRVAAQAVNGFVDDEVFKREFLLEVKDTFEDELADVVIRVMDLCAFKGIDLEQHIKAKMRYNSLRPHKHGKKY